MSKLREEFDRIQQHDFELNFVYPNEETRKFLKVVNRDGTVAEEKAARGASRSFENPEGHG